MVQQETRKRNGSVCFSVINSEGQNDLFKDRLYPKTVRLKVQKKYRIDINGGGVVLIVLHSLYACLYNTFVCVRNKTLKFHIRNSDTRKY